MVNKTWFSRAIFFSWSCDKGDCKYCYMSTVPKDTKRVARRRIESILAEVVLCKKLGWDIGFVSGGCNAYKNVEFVNLLDLITKVYGDKVWINVGELTDEELKMFSPYLKGIAAAVETVNPKLHDYVCPSKPLGPIQETLLNADKYGLQKAMTIILGMGETIEDYPLLRDFVAKYGISKIHYYSLNPHKGTVFENYESPSKEYQGEWIEKTKQDFPEISIHAGIWKNKVDNIEYLLKKGADCITKFPAMKEFNSPAAQELEAQVAKAGYEFEGTLTQVPEFDIDAEVDSLDVPEERKALIKKKIESYLKRMRKIKE